jgi:hypothetical protein
MTHMPVLIPPTAQDRSPQQGDLRLQMTVAKFGATYGHCDSIANYLARYAADRENDVDRAVMRFAAIFNEVLEVFYRHGSHGTQLLLDLERTPDLVTLQVRASGNAENRSFLRHAQELVEMPDARSWYHSQLAQGAPENEASALALVDVVTSGQGKLAFSDHPETNTVQVTTTLSTLEDAR